MRRAAGRRRQGTPVGAVPREGSSEKEGGSGGDEAGLGRLGRLEGSGFPEVGKEPLQGAAAVGDGVLLGKGKSGEAPPQGRVEEDGIVAEAVAPCGFE